MENLYDRLRSLSDKTGMKDLTKLLEGVMSALSSRTIDTPVLAIGSSSTAKVLITNAVLVFVNGKIVLVPASTTAGTEAPLTGTIADGYINMYGIYVDAAGTLSSALGTPTLIANGIGGVIPPPTPLKKTCLGYVTVSTTGAAFTGGTTALSAGTATDLYYNVAGPCDPSAVIL